MKDQYAGDISDYLKFTFLRTVTQNDIPLGIAWYYNPGNDGRPDGRHVEYQHQDEWRALDPSVYDQLSAMTEPSVIALECLHFWRNHVVKFHREPVELGGQRQDWVQGMVNAMQDAQLVFLDPDNGLGLDIRKHARVADLEALHQNNRAISIINFPKRTNHMDQIDDIHNTLVNAGYQNPFTLVTYVGVPNNNGFVPRFRFITIAGANNVVRNRAMEYLNLLNNLPPATRITANLIG